MTGSASRPPERIFVVPDLHDAVVEPDESNNLSVAATYRVYVPLLRGEGTA